MPVDVDPICIRRNLGRINGASSRDALLCHMFPPHLIQVSSSSSPLNLKLDLEVEWMEIQYTKNAWR